MSWSDIDALLNVHPIVMAQVILIKVSNSLIHNKKVDPLAIFNSGFHDKIYFVSLQLNSEKQKKLQIFLKVQVLFLRCNNLLLLI